MPRAGIAEDSNDSLPASSSDGFCEPNARYQVASAAGPQKQSVMLDKIPRHTNGLRICYSECIVDNGVSYFEIPSEPVDTSGHWRIIFVLELRRRMSSLLTFLPPRCQPGEHPHGILPDLQARP